MVAMSETTKVFLREYRWLGLATTFMILSFAGLLTVIFMDTPSDKKVRAACDKYISDLRYSDSLLEVTRAGLMADRLNCGTRRRL